MPPTWGSVGLWPEGPIQLVGPSGQGLGRGPFERSGSTFECSEVPFGHSGGPFGRSEGSFWQLEGHFWALEGPSRALGELSGAFRGSFEAPVDSLRCLVALTSAQEAPNSNKRVLSGDGRAHLGVWGPFRALSLGQWRSQGSGGGGIKGLKPPQSVRNSLSSPTWKDPLSALKGHWTLKRAL